MGFPEEGRPRCPICGEEDLKKIYAGFIRNGRTYDVCHCPGCRLALTHPFPNAAELNELYSANTYRAHGKRFISALEWAVRRFRKKRLKSVETFSQRGRILDIGCARGYFLSLARRAGWEPYGLEFNDETAYNARDVFGLDVRTGALKDTAFEGGFFDAVTIWHVLEHLPDPLGTVRECHRVLKPGGLLAVSVPNFESLQASISREHWFHLDVPYHFYHFSLHALAKLLREHRFRVVRVAHFSFEFNPFGFLQSIFNMMGVRHNYLYDILKNSRLRGKAGPLPYKDMLLMMVSSPMALPVSAVLSLAEAAAKKGGTVEVYAKKEEA